MTTGRINQVTITARTPFFLFKRKTRSSSLPPLALCALRLPVRVSFHRLKHFSKVRPGCVLTFGAPPRSFDPRSSLPKSFACLSFSAGLCVALVSRQLSHLRLLLYKSTTMTWLHEPC